MRLNIGDIVEYENTIYQVFAVVFTTLYLRKSLDVDAIYKYTMEQIYEKYHDVEFI